LPKDATKITPNRIHRRTLLAYITRLAILATFPGWHKAADAATKHDELKRMARLLYPHESLPDEVYGDVLSPMLADGGPSLVATLDAGTQRLNEVSGGDWLSLDRKRQVESLATLEDSDFFVMLQEHVRLWLYRNPEVWKVIGYPGPSAPVGYIDRGFDDIDWLDKL
jgi:hypothetical protein